MKVKLIMMWMKERKKQNGNICKEDLTSGEGKPQEEPLDDPEDDKISSMQAQMKVLWKLLKQQREELKQKDGISVDMVNITGCHKNFMELVKSLDDSMWEIAGVPKLPSATVQQLQPTTSKATTSHTDLTKPTHEVIHGKARYRCPPNANTPK